MTEKTARQIEAMKNDYNFGVEVEMNHITRQNAAKLAADFFGTGRYENTAYRNGYMTHSAYDQQGREWKFSRDVNIAGPDDERCELVTPILGWDDIPTLQELLRKLRMEKRRTGKGGAGMRMIRPEQLRHLRETYPAGTRVELIQMDDVQAPPAGTCGTVTGVDDTGSLMVRWDNGSGLNVIYGVDVVRKVVDAND